MNIVNQYQDKFEKICGIQQLMNDFNGKKSNVNADDTDQENSLSSDMLLLMNFKGQKGSKGPSSNMQLNGHDD